MPKIKFVELKKSDRENYPKLKTITELKKMKLMPRPRVKPRGLYIYYTPTFKKETTYLYDVDLTMPYKLTPEQQEKRKAYAKRYRLRKARERKEKKAEEEFRTFTKKRIEELKNEAPKPYQKLIIDTETTGLDWFKDELLQVSILNEKGEVLFNEYVRPTRHTEWYNAECIHGISPEDVKGCKTIRELWEDIQKIILTATEIIGYNIEFDQQMLFWSGIYFPEEIEYFDVMEEFAYIYGDWNERFQNCNYKKLTECAEYYNYTDYKAHDSLEDAKATLYCYEKVLKVLAYDAENNSQIA